MWSINYECLYTIGTIRHCFYDSKHWLNAQGDHYSITKGGGAEWTHYFFYFLSAELFFPIKWALRDLRVVKFK